jgi:hypothetical protein
MKNFLLFAFCFFFLQILSCSIGEIEPQPEATKLTIQNNSTVILRNVIWNGTNFDDLELGWTSERDVSYGEGYVYFEADNGESYHTRELVIGEKYRSSKFAFIDGTVIVNNNSKIQSSLGKIFEENINAN